MAIFRKKKQQQLCHGLHLMMDFNITSYVRYNILSKFDFQGARLKVKVVVAFFFFRKKKNKQKKTKKTRTKKNNNKKQKNFAIALVPTFINGF